MKLSEREWKQRDWCGLIRKHSRIFTVLRLTERTANSRSVRTFSTKCIAVRPAI